MSLSHISRIRNEDTRAITAENPRGEKGKGGQAASNLGAGRKGAPCLRHIPSGKTVTLGDITGPGEIRHIWITVPDKTPAGEFVLRDLVLRMYWDKEDEPSVEVPLGDFFCNGFALPKNIISHVVNVNPIRGLNMYFPMPFAKHARIEIENQHQGEIEVLFFQIDYCLYRDGLPANTAYFHAQWRREAITTTGVDYTILDNVQGRGHYVGTYLALAALERFWYGEGEIKFYLDGDTTLPTICGTGLEDYVGGAWSFLEPEGDNIVEKSYCAPFLGHVVVNENYPQIRNSCVDMSIPMHSLYRWHLPDPVCFTQDLRVTVQQIGINDRGLFERQDDVSSVAYWYQEEPHIPFPALLKREKRWPR